MSNVFKPPIVPAAFFGIVLGLAGLGLAWRAAHQVWHLPAIVGEIILGLASVVWAALIALFALRWIFARAESLDCAGTPAAAGCGSASGAGRAGLTHYFICPISCAAPFAVFANFNSASRPPAA
ncbi:hypothetical protein [Bradyrhizobium sp. CCBAU 53338]|uniref:SLAC1 family transporter n=1 Tax=Bradyrhizobium sp. CCBAU 53338 TaxID=1325111 RepID=UPI001FEF361E|nr:hypothetical protein [Bradyrhizobium sp. CCBAU 53338]